MSEVKRYLADEQYPGQYSARCDLVPSEAFDAAQSELAALREELTQAECMRENYKIDAAVYRDALAAAEQRNAELKQQLDSIDKHLRGSVNDSDPLPPIMPGAFSYTTTYGLVAGLRRERDYLKKSATPLPAGDDYLRQLAQRLREYIRNPHHIDPISEAFKRLIGDSSFALSKLSAIKPTESGASGSTCNQIREESGLPINNPCIACKNGACIDK